MTDKEKIRAEVERRIEELQPCNTRDNLRAHGAIAGYYQILSFINSMQEEPVSKDVEQEIEKYFANWLQGASDEGCFNANSELVSIYDCHRIARHFANWQKEQMMKKAVECDVIGHCSGWLHLGYLPECEYDFKEGQKVKVIVIKEE